MQHPQRRERETSPFWVIWSYNKNEEDEKRHVERGISYLKGMLEELEERLENLKKNSSEK